MIENVILGLFGMIGVVMLIMFIGMAFIDFNNMGLSTFYFFFMLLLFLGTKYGIDADNIALDGEALIAGAMQYVFTNNVFLFLLSVHAGAIICALFYHIYHRVKKKSGNNVSVSF